MCVGFWSLEHPDYALILCANRDEFLARPTTAAHWHRFETGPAAAEEDPAGNVLSGRDLRAGGTWLGASRAGRVAFLTNITEEHRPYASTRGALASAFLLPDRPGEPMQDHLAHLLQENRAYAGFNLLLLDPRADAAQGLAYDAAYVTNHGGGGPIAARPLSDDERRCGGLSNGVDGHGAEAWPKVRLGAAMFRDELRGVTSATPEDDLVARLFHLLTWRSDAPPRARAELRNTIHIEPLPVTAGGEHALYGTRLSTVLLVRRDGAAAFFERDIWVLDAAGQATRGDAAAQRVFRFRVGSAGSPAP
ncbi:NRDE family protein [Phanerochaete sordida]|uniref:NRDE family protein n=1 Tax=Phanerochaete sordida TaxID=48140 RepID=A0A9P3GB86_9APHY|nr:NRDE family protein [Phanerochaete sordida]